MSSFVHGCVLQNVWLSGHFKTVIENIKMLRFDILYFDFSLYKLNRES